MLNNMHACNGWGGFAPLNCMTVLYGLAVVPPPLFALVLAVHSLLPGPPAVAPEADADSGATVGL